MYRRHIWYYYHTGYLCLPGCCFNFLIFFDFLFLDKSRELLLPIFKFSCLKVFSLYEKYNGVKVSNAWLHLTLVENMTLVEVIFCLFFFLMLQSPD